MRSSNVTRSTPLIVTTLNWIIRLNDRQTNLGSINKKLSNKEKAPGSFDWHVPTTTRHGLIRAQRKLRDWYKAQRKGCNQIKGEFGFIRSLSFFHQSHSEMKQNRGKFWLLRHSTEQFYPWKSKMATHYFALWLVHKTRATLSTNQMQNLKKKRDLGAHVVRDSSCYYFECPVTPYEYNCLVLRTPSKCALIK